MGSRAASGGWLWEALTKTGGSGLRRQSASGGGESRGGGNSDHDDLRERRRRPKRSGVRGIAAPREECQPPASTRYRLLAASWFPSGGSPRPAFLPLVIAGIRARYIRDRGTPPLLPGPPLLQAWRPLGLGPSLPRLNDSIACVHGRAIYSLGLLQSTSSGPCLVQAGLWLNVLPSLTVVGRGS